MCGTPAAVVGSGFNPKLPRASRPPDRPPDKRDIRVVDITSQGVYMLDRRRMSLDDIERALIAANRADPNTVVYIRADENGRDKDLYAVIDRCQRNGLTRFSLRTEPPGNP